MPNNQHLGHVDRAESVRSSLVTPQAARSTSLSALDLLSLGVFDALSPNDPLRDSLQVAGNQQHRGRRERLWSKVLGGQPMECLARFGVNEKMRCAAHTVLGNLRAVDSSHPIGLMVLLVRPLSQTLRVRRSAQKLKPLKCAWRDNAKYRPKNHAK